MKTTLPLCAVLLVATTTAADGETKTKKDSSDTSKEVAYGTFGATQGRVSAVVSAYLASFERSDDHFALQVAVGVTGEGPELNFKEQSFWLVDAQGISHEMSPAEALSKDVSLLEFANDMEERFPLQLPKNFYFLNRVSSDFYSLDNLRWTTVNLDDDTFFEDVLFFVHPAGGLDGVLTLQVAGDGMDDALEIKFTVPPDKKQYKKQHKKNTKQRADDGAPT